MSEDKIDRALKAWFDNTKHGWRKAMQAAIEAAEEAK